uniref:Uncharacterized protein n=1 Tax=Branchiostoma floridae TaxID=7739 RepID=C3Z5K2_BRAFL|eukprot:XP_002596103.1 hypothetical protein BRAFLDRAFT_66165 [Branchiostoma floridae]
MAKVILLLVASVTVLSGIIEGKTRCRSTMKRSDPGPGGYRVFNRKQLAIITPLLNLREPKRNLNKSLNKRTDAPFRMVTDCNRDRIPRDILVARCREEACDDDASWVKGNTYASKLVVWKVRVNGKLQYHAQREKVPVACTCMRPLVAGPG